MSKPLALIPAYSHIDHRLLKVLRATGMPYLEIYGCSDLVRARSGLLSDGMRTDADRFVFIDADIVPTEHDLIELAESAKVDAHNAVSGCYVVRSSRLAAQSEDECSTLFAAERFTPMLVAGMGFAAVHRDAVQRLQVSLPTLRDDIGQSWQPFFLPVVAQQQTPDGLLQEYLPEDYSFWWRLRHVDVNLWLDTHLVVGHVKQTILRPTENEDGDNFVWAPPAVPQSGSQSVSDLPSSHLSTL